MNLITESVQIGQRICNTLLNLGFYGVVVVLGALGEDVLSSSRLARMQKPVSVKVVRLKELDPKKLIIISQILDIKSEQIGERKLCCISNF